METGPALKSKKVYISDARKLRIENCVSQECESECTFTYRKNSVIHTTGIVIGRKRCSGVWVNQYSERNILIVRLESGETVSIFKDEAITLY